MELRPYQREAVYAVYRHLRERDDNPCVVIPTAGGKTALISTICRDAVTLWGGRVLVLAHVKELLEQAADKLLAMAPDLRSQMGIYSAGLKRRDTEHPILIAGIQSVYQKADLLDRFDIILIDECHLIPPEGEGMYRRFLADARVVNPQVRLIGLTATPFRMSSGPIATPEGILNHICYQIGIRELIRDGYLCPLRSKAGRASGDTSQLHVRGGEFIADEVEELMDQDALVRTACAEVIEQTQDRRSVLIFAAGVKHGRHIVEVLHSEHGAECGFVTGQTPAAEREALIARFRGEGGRELFSGSGPLKFLCNVNVLTTGFDAPNVDCVVLLRPTMSPGLLVQMIGRGFRLHPSKADCLVLDYGNNLLRHGPVDEITAEAKSSAGEGQAPAKACPQCHTVVAAGYGRCPECGFEFPPPQRQKHDAQASTAGVLSGEVTISEHAVSGVHYSVHTKKGAAEDAPRSMRVEYEIGYYRYQSEWICFEHTGYARMKAEGWWQRRCSLPVPDTAAQAVELARAGVLAPTRGLKVRHVAGEPYARICDYELGEAPDCSKLALRGDAYEGDLPETVGAAEDDIPFPSALAA